MKLDQAPYPLVDLSLSRRLERAEGSANAGSVEARARISPSSGATWIDIAGTYAMFDGPTSPLTQTFGLGLFEKIRAAEVEALERFFGDRGAPVFHEVSPLAPVDLLPLLSERGYRPFELTNVLFRPTAPLGGAGTAARLTVRVAGRDEEDAWASTACAGWSEFPEVGAFMRDIGRLTMATEDAVCFVAEAAAVPIATAVLRIHDGVAVLAGASTVPAARGQGAQLALLDARLRFAAERGCDLAMMGALPGSASQRNAERHGFRIAYTRIKWARGA